MRRTTRIEEAGRLPVPADYAFDFVTDVGNWPSYWPGLLEISDPEARWGRPGDHVDVVVRFLLGPVAVVLTLDELRPPERIAFRSEQSGLPAARHARRFTPADGGCEYRLVVEYEARRWVAGLLDRTLVAWGLRRALRKTLVNLGRVLG